MFMRVSDLRPYPLIISRLVCGTTLSLLAALNLPWSSALAQTVATAPLLTQPEPKAPASGSAARKSNTVTISSKPAWQDLTRVQQMSLEPLAAKWNSLGEAQKRKWLAIASNYPKLTPQEQEKLHSRMTEWVSLSQQQRAEARLNFAQSKQLTPSQKNATWQAYQELSPEEKQKLATSATPKPAGAAAAAKPIPPQKLAVAPVTKPSPKAPPKMAASNHTLNHNTLLPPIQPALAPASTQKN